MKKLLALFIVLLLGVVINYGLWFFHTRTINSLISILDERISDLGGEFKYEEVVFDTFKSWSVQGAIIKPRVLFKDKILKQILELELDRINFDSLPFDGKLLFKVNGDSQYKVLGENNTIKKAIKIAHTNSSVSIAELVFYASLRDLVEIVAQNRNQSVFNVLKSFDFNSGAVSFIEETKGEYFTAENIHLLINGQVKNNELSYDLLFDFKDGQYNSKYEVGDKEKNLYDNLKRMGKINLIINFIYNQWQSKKQSEFIKSAKDNKGIELAPVVDANRWKLNTLNYETGLFSINIGGGVEAESSNFSSEFKIVIHKYDSFVSFIVEYINYYIEQLRSSSVSGYLISRIDENKTQKVKQFLKQFAVNNEDLNIDIIKNKNQTLTISGKSWSDIIMQLQNIFSSPKDPNSAIGNKSMLPLPGVNQKPKDTVRLKEKLDKRG